MEHWAANLLTGHVRAVLESSRAQNVRFQQAPAALWFQAVAIAQFSRCLQVFSRSHQLSDLPDMSQIVPWSTHAAFVAG
jgi:hypothetical protein